MIAFSSCKINLGLEILGKRADSYHELQTLFLNVPLYDVLDGIKVTETKAPKIQLSNFGIPIPGENSDNLIIKAFEALDKKYQLPNTAFALLKNTPMGAGLGGGSANGAAAIKLLNKLYHLNLSKTEQLEIAAGLGSDCAFFIEEKPCLGLGRGEFLYPINLKLQGYWIVLVKPPIHVNTAKAFALLNIKKQVEATNKDNFLEKVNANPYLKEITKPIESWKDYFKNDFEPVVFEMHPELAKLKETLYAQGALYASMSGSGSTLYGIFDREKAIQGLFPGCFYFESAFS